MALSFALTFPFIKFEVCLSFAWYKPKWTLSKCPIGDGKRNRFSGDGLTSTLLTWTVGNCYSCNEFYFATSCCQLLILQIQLWTLTSKEYNHVVMDMGKLKWNAAGQYVKHSCSILVISGFLFSILYMTQKLQ